MAIAREELRTLADLTRFADEHFGDKPFLKYKQGKDVAEKSFTQIRRDSEAFSRFLEQQGQIGGHVAVIGPTSAPWIAAYLGTVNSGGVIIPLDRELPLDDLCDVLDRADASVLVYDELYQDAAKAARERCPKLKLCVNMQRETDDGQDFSFPKLLTDCEGSFSCELDPEKLCAILYTSGTTGKSKGVMLSHSRLIDNVVCDDMGMEPGSGVTLTVLPIHHAYCFTCDILLGLYLGATVCVNDSIMHLAKNLKLFQPTIMLVVPMIAQSMYYKLCEAAKGAPQAPKPMIAAAAFGGNLKTIFSGGAYLDPKLVAGFEEFGIALVQGYGMTECSPRISSNHVGKVKADSIGQVVDGCSVKIVDGEIWAKSKSVMIGYYHDEAATSETLEDGWLKTGDLGHVDEENFLYITGRRKNLIILSNGENISPEELENKLYANPLAGELLVYSENGVITAEIFPNADVAAAMGVTDPEAALSAFVEQVNAGLPLSKQIRNVKFRTEEFEKTTSKKIKRKYHS